MRTMQFNKRCNVETLTAELKAANFSIEGVSNYETTTTVYLKDTEIKNPTTIVNNHVYTEPIRPDLKAEYQAASTVADKLQFIAKRLGLT